MQGVRIVIYYGYRYYDEEYDIEKTGYDYVRIDESNDRGQGISNYIKNILQRLI